MKKERERERDIQFEFKKEVAAAFFGSKLKQETVFSLLKIGQADIQMCTCSNNLYHSKVHDLDSFKRKLELIPIDLDLRVLFVSY